MTSLLQASYGVSFVSHTKKNDRAISRAHCIGTPSLPRCRWCGGRKYLPMATWRGWPSRTQSTMNSGWNTARCSVRYEPLEKMLQSKTGICITFPVNMLTGVKQCTFHWLISSDIAQNEMVLSSLIIHHLIIITCISHEIMFTISLPKLINIALLWTCVIHVTDAIRHCNTDYSGLEWSNINTFWY